MITRKLCIDENNGVNLARILDEVLKKENILMNHDFWKEISNVIKDYEKKNFG